MNWQLTTLGEYFEITSSKRVFKKDWKGSGVPFYRAREIVKLAKNGSVEDDLFISNEMYAEYSEKYGSPKAGDILVTGVGTLGIVYIVQKGDKFYFKDGNIIWLKKKKAVDSRFIEYAFKTGEIQRYIQNSPGATVGTYTISKANQTPISIPPLAEQQKIAAILDAADQLRQKDQQLIEHYTRLGQSLFLEMFGDPVSNDNKYKVVNLSDVTSKITDGVHAKPEYTETGVPFISVKDVTTGALIFDKCKFISKAAHEKYYKRCNPEKGDIIYTKVGATYGRPAIVDVGFQFSLYVSVALIKPIKGLINPIFLKEAMANPAIKRQADRSIKGIGVPDLHLNMIKKFTIPLPPLTLQNQFAQHIEAIEQQKQQAQSSLEKSEDLFNSLLQRAFKGELTG